jgi:hypothetical protein
VKMLCYTPFDITLPFLELGFRFHVHVNNASMLSLDASFFRVSGMQGLTMAAAVLSSTTANSAWPAVCSGIIE